MQNSSSEPIGPYTQWLPVKYGPILRDMVLDASNMTNGWRPTMDLMCEITGPFNGIPPAGALFLAGQDKLIRLPEQSWLRSPVTVLAVVCTYVYMWHTLLKKRTSPKYLVESKDRICACPHKSLQSTGKTEVKSWEQYRGVSFRRPPSLSCCLFRTTSQSTSSPHPPMSSRTRRSSFRSFARAFGKRVCVGAASSLTPFALENLPGKKNYARQIRLYIYILLCMCPDGTCASMWSISPSFTRILFCVPLLCMTNFHRIKLPVLILSSILGFWETICFTRQIIILTDRAVY